MLLLVVNLKHSDRSAEISFMRCYSRNFFSMILFSGIFPVYRMSTFWAQMSTDWCQSCSIFYASVFAAQFTRAILDAWYKTRLYKFRILTRLWCVRCCYFYLLHVYWLQPKSWIYVSQTDFMLWGSWEALLSGELWQCSGVIITAQSEETVIVTSYNLAEVWSMRYNSYNLAS